MATTDPSNSRHRFVFSSALVAAVFALPVGGLLGARFLGPERPDELTQKVRPILFAARGGEAETVQPAVARLVWAEGVKVPAPAWSGTVTGVHVRAGDVVSSGSKVLTIDGVVRIASAGGSPFWRDLHPGDTGDDVGSLSHLLSKLGILPRGEGGSRIFSERTARAVTRLAKSLGAVRPGGSFERAWVIWIPVPRLVVGEVLAETGGSAPPPGTLVVTGRKRLVRAELSSPGEGGIRGGQAVTFETHKVNVRVADGANVIAQQDLVLLGEHLDQTDDSVEGLLHRKLSASALLIPASAVALAEDGRECVWVASGGRFNPAAVESIPGDAGSVFVTNGLSDGQQVLVNKAAILKDDTCP